MVYSRATQREHAPSRGRDVGTLCTVSTDTTARISQCSLWHAATALRLKRKTFPFPTRHLFAKDGQRRHSAFYSQGQPAAAHTKS